MPSGIQVIQLSELDTLPKTSRCPADMDCDGATVIVLQDGSLRVAVWSAKGDMTPSIRYSYHLDTSGNYILGSARYRGDLPTTSDRA